MRVTVLALAAIVTRTVVLPAQATPSTFPSDSAIRAILEQRVAERRSAGIVVGVLDPSGATRIVAVGDPGPGQPPLDGNSVFEIGSISKVFTSTVLADLVKRGAVHLDDPVQRFLPASVRVPSRDGKQITLGNLSEQNSGLPRLPTNMRPADQENPYADYSVAQLYDFLSHYELPRDPGAQFEYSNLGVGLLGHALALSQHTTYEDLARKLVWRPLGMTSTAIVLTPAMRAHLALGHDEQGRVTKNWDLPTLAGAGAIRSTAVDMLKFAEANVHPERGPLEAAMRFAQQPRAEAGNSATQIGLNWIIQHVGPETMVWHNGGTGGYRTFLGLDPAAKRAVVVLTNSGGEGADDIGAHLLFPALPLTPKPATHTAIDLPASALAKFVGVYDFTPDLAITVTLNDGALYAQATNQQRLRLWPESATAFFIKEGDIQLVFHVDDQGNVPSAELHQSGAAVVGRRRP